MLNGADILHNFRSNKKVLVVIDFEPMLSECPEQFVDYLDVYELTLLITPLLQLTPIFIHLRIYDALQLLSNQVLKLFVANCSDVASQDHPLELLLELFQITPTFIHQFVY